MNKDFVEEYAIVKKHSLNEHHAIVQAIEQKNPVKAAEAMRCHMNNSRERRVGSGPLSESVT